MRKTRLLEAYACTLTGLAVGSDYYGGCHSVHALFHESNISIPMSSKSRTLRVATAMPNERAIAAIWQST